MTVREQADTGMEELAREVAAELAWVAVKLHGKETLREITPLMTPLIRAALTRWADKVRREQMERDCAAVCDGCRKGMRSVLSDVFMAWVHLDSDGLASPCYAHCLRSAFQGEEPPDEKREADR